MEIAAEDSFRIRSYRNGATAVEGYPEQIEDILRNPERKVTDIPGIGKGLAAVLGEIVDHGSCERRDALLERFPSNYLNRVLYPIKRDLGLKKLNFQILRRSFTTRGQEFGSLKDL